MTARTDLENAFSILDAGITAHVTALKASRAAHAITQAVADDETYLKGLTTKVLSWADTLVNSSTEAAVVAEVVAPAVVPAVAPAAPPPLPAFLAQAAVPTPVLPQAAPQPLQAPPVAVAPVAAPVAPTEGFHVPSVAETMAAVTALAHKAFPNA